MPMLMRDSLGYSAFASKQDALLSHSPLAGLALPHQFPFNPLSPLGFQPQNFLTPSSSSTQSPPDPRPAPLLPQHHQALLSAFSQNMKAAPKLWWGERGEGGQGGPGRTEVPQIYKETQSEAKQVPKYWKQMSVLPIRFEVLCFYQKYFLADLYNKQRQTILIQFYIQIIVYQPSMFSQRTEARGQRIEINRDWCGLIMTFPNLLFLTNPTKLMLISKMITLSYQLCKVLALVRQLLVYSTYISNYQLYLELNKWYFSFYNTLFYSHALNLNGMQF